MAATEIATLFLDRNLRILRFTPRVSELFNVLMTDRGRPLTDITHRLGYDELQSDAKGVLDRLVPVVREVQDEAGRWYLTRVLPYRSTTDRIEGVVITFVDITERISAETAVRRSEERFRALIDASAQMVWTADARGQRSDDSPSWRAFTGQTFEQQRGLGWLEAIHPDDRSATESAWREHVQSQSPLVAECRVYCAAKNAYRWTTMRAVPLPSADAAMHGWVGMNSDITERKEAEEALRQSEAFHRLAVEAGRIGTWDLDLQTDACEISPIMAELFGFPQDQRSVAGRQWREAIIPEDRSRMDEAIQHAVANRTPLDLTFRIRLADGRLRWLHSRGAVGREEGGQPRNIRGASTDVTDRKQDEQEVQANDG